MSGYHVVGDWGTSRLRLFRIEDGAVTDRRDGPGIGVLDRAPEAVLRDALVPWRENGEPGSIALCGMIGSRNGWREVPYVDCPTDVAGWLAGAAHLPLDGIDVAIMAGLAGRAPSGAADVMRGEETQMFGAMALDPRLKEGRHRIVLPGTHSKWATLEAGRITGFQTFLTGEMFALLRDHSILTRAAAPAAIAPADDEAGFEHGLARAHDGLLLGALFEARSAQLRDGRSPGWTLGYLSGLLIGCEIAEATATLATAERVILIGDPLLGQRYRRALSARGVVAETLDGDACVLAGLTLLETHR